MRVLLTDRARADLAQIGEFIAQDNPGRARSFVRELVAAAQGIGRTPYGFQEVDRLRNAGVRRRPHGSYVIFYRIADGRIEILHILHGARDYEAILFPDD